MVTHRSQDQKRDCVTSLNALRGKEKEREIIWPESLGHALCKWNKVHGSDWKCEKGQLWHIAICAAT